MKQTFFITINDYNSDVKNIWTIDFDDTENYYIVKNDDKIIKTTSKGLHMFFLQTIKTYWNDASEIIFKCSELEKYFFADSSFKDNKQKIQKKLIFFIEFQMETF